MFLNVTTQEHAIAKLKNSIFRSIYLKLNEYLMGSLKKVVAIMFEQMYFLGKTKMCFSLSRLKLSIS